MSLRPAGGSVWLNARSMSSRSGAVYARPVSPVRASVVSAAVRAHWRATAARMVSMTSSSNRGAASSGSAKSESSDDGGAAASEITAVSGRGLASPPRMALASAEMMARASSGCGLHFSGGNRIWVRGWADGCRARHTMAPTASWRRATGESWATGAVSVSSR